MKHNSSKKQFNLIDSRYLDNYFCIYRDRSHPRTGTPQDFLIWCSAILRPGSKTSNVTAARSRS